jgi:hypothetical protein
VAPSSLEGVQHLAATSLLHHWTGQRRWGAETATAACWQRADAPGPEHRAQTAPGLDPVRVAGAGHEVGVAGQQPLAGG